MKCAWCDAEPTWWFRGPTVAGFACIQHHSRYAGMDYRWVAISDLTKAGVLNEARALVEQPRCITCGHVVAA